ncbi:MAG: F0F1 ATP synthase subunit A [Planctomycetaceae bacterium]
MADAVLHIKDSYYFEVPRSLWRQDFESLEEVPAFLREAHPAASLEDFEQALAGKILIPQPFGRLQNLYEKHPTEGGFCISKFMILELVAAILLLVVFRTLAKRIEGGRVPPGKFWNMLESMLLFVRDQVARAAIGSGNPHSVHDTGEDYPAAVETFDPDRHPEPLATHAPVVDAAAHRERGHHREGHTHHGPTGDTFAPLLWTVFFFILTLNLIGMVPWLGAPTAAFAVTLGMASVILVTTFGSGLKTFGVKWLWTGFVPHMDLPWYVWPLKIMIWFIEVAGSLIKHFVLAVRLLANMVAGHLVLLGILSMATVVATIGAALFSGLELFVAFLQAYIFTFLAALFIGAAVHEH